MRAKALGFLASSHAWECSAPTRHLSLSAGSSDELGSLDSCPSGTAQGTDGRRPPLISVDHETAAALVLTGSSSRSPIRVAPSEPAAPPSSLIVGLDLSIRGSGRLSRSLEWAITSLVASLLEEDERGEAPGQARQRMRRCSPTPLTGRRKASSPQTHGGRPGAAESSSSAPELPQAEVRLPDIRARARVQAAPGRDPASV